MVIDKWDMRVYRRMSALKKAIEKRDAALERLQQAEEEYLKAKDNVKTCEIGLVIETQRIDQVKEESDEHRTAAE